MSATKVTPLELRFSNVPDVTNSPKNSPRSRSPPRSSAIAISPRSGLCPHGAPHSSSLSPRQSPRNSLSNSRFHPNSQTSQSLPKNACFRTTSNSSLSPGSSPRSPSLSYLSPSNSSASLTSSSGNSSGNISRSVSTTEVIKDANVKDKDLETKVLVCYAEWLQQEIKRLQGRLQEQIEARTKLNEKLSSITEDFETEIRRRVVRGVCESVSKGSVVAAKKKTFFGFVGGSSSTYASTSTSSNKPPPRTSSLSKPSPPPVYEDSSLDDLEIETTKRIFTYDDISTSSSCSSLISPSDSTSSIISSSSSSSSIRISPRTRTNSQLKVRFCEFDTVVLYHEDEQEKHTIKSNSPPHRADANEFVKTENNIIQHEPTLIA